MENIIEIRNLNFAYDDKKIFENLSLDIKMGQWTTILGKNGSGKSTLTKILLGLVPITNNDFVLINKKVLNKNIETIKEIRREVSVIFTDPDQQFIAETIMDDITSTLENYGYSSDQIKDKLKIVKELYGNDDILSKSSLEITNSEKQIIGIISALILNLRIIILDEGFSMMDEQTKTKAISLLKRYQEKDKLTIINITHSPDECIYGDTIIILDQGKAIITGATNEVLTQIDLFENNDLESHFIVNLSNKLKAYNLIDKIFIDEEELIDKLWE